MKRFGTIAIALSAVLILAPPVMALETTFSGDIYARGFHSEHQGLQETDAVNTYLDMRFRLKTVFQITDNLKLTTRFDALDEKVWGDTDDPDIAGMDGGQNIDFDRAFLSFTTRWGIFGIGRMGGAGDSAFGLTFLDNEENREIDRDRIRYTLPLGDFTFQAVFAKKASGDDGDFTQSDSDWTGYSLAGDYTFSAGRLGILLHMDSDQRRPDMDGDGVPDALDWNGDGRPDVDADRKEFFANPYWDLAVTDTINVRGEIKYEVGKWEYDAGPASEIQRFAANIEVTAALPTSRPARVTAGWAYISGDANSLAATHIVGEYDVAPPADNNEETWFKGGVGADWERIWILTNGSDRGAQTLGGIGNLAYGAGRYGANITYLGLTVSPLEGLDVGVLFASSLATDVASEWSDEHGLEWDVSLSYKVMGNLTYDIVVAFLSAGDFWELGDPTRDVANTFAVYQKLTLRF